MPKKLKFPKDFLWGAATSAHQIEGNNTYSDWWAWEKSAKREDWLKSKGKNVKDYLSAEACDSYNRFDEDFELAKHLNHNATRLSVEWSRIEPKEGEFNEEAIEHYEKVLRSAKFHGLQTFVTLHHFTLPLWFAQKGGFAKKENINKFLKYVEFTVRRLDQYTDFWLTINEPNVYAGMAYRYGEFPPNKKSWFLAFKVLKNLFTAHNKAALYIKHNFSKPVGLAYNLFAAQPVNALGELTAKLDKKINNFFILNNTVGTCDFIGVNYYFFHHTNSKGKVECSHEKSDIGWGIHPEGLEQILLDLKRYNKPIYITENGLADAGDSKREKFIKDHLYYLHRSIERGADVRGYLHWSLIDNFEWAMGFGPRFGLIEIDREDLLRRKIRYSATKYAEICKNNYIEI